MRIEIDPHAAARLAVRGATAAEADKTVRAGTPSPVKHGRTAFTLEILEPVAWRGRVFRGRRITCYAAPIEDGWRVITVIVQISEDLMRITYDPDVNAAYIYLSDRRGEVETHVVSDDVTLDVFPDGTLLGIELLNANSQLQTDGGILTVFNQVTGEETHINLTAA